MIINNGLYTDLMFQKYFVYKLNNATVVNFKNKFNVDLFYFIIYFKIITNEIRQGEINNKGYINGNCRKPTNDKSTIY